MYRPYQSHDFTPTREQMIRIIRENISPISKTEIVSLADSLGRICAQEVHSQNRLPNRPASQLDGIGVRFADFQNGMPDTARWKEGEEYYFSNTGVAIRDGYDTVVVIEKVSFDAEGRLRIAQVPSAPGEHVSPAGHFLEIGELLATPGMRMAPAHLGCFASGGITEVEVYKKPVVAIIPTGNELVPAGGPVPAGKNVESNSVMMAAFLREWGAEPLVLPIIPDEPQLIRAALESALARSDMVILNAGSSKGSMDYNIDVLEQMGRVLVYELGHGPGKHASFSMVGSQPVMGIAGPPVGAEITTDFYVHAAVDFFLGQPDVVPPLLEAALQEDFGGMRIDFCARLHIYLEDGVYKAVTVPRSMSRGRSVLHANARLYLHAGDTYTKGDLVRAELLVPKEYIR